MEQIKYYAQEIFEEAVALRRKLHEMPELAFEEYQTAELIKEKLNEWGIPYREGIAGTGIAAVLENGAGRCVAMRADMDALPIKEETDCAFASKTDGKMHACGHDAHMAIVLGTAYVLSKTKDKWRGTVKFLFEPGEETDGGARPMIAEGVLRNPDADICLGVHVMNETDVGTILLSEGAAMAADDEFDLVICGKGGHAAWPQDAVDPIAAACQIVTALQNVVSRNADPQEAAVISVTAVEGGTAYNVIPNEVHLKGTVRSLNEKTGELLKNRLEDVVKGVSAAFGTTYALDYRQIYPPTVNAPEVNRLVEEALVPFAELRVAWSRESSMGSDDFSFFSQAVPSAYIKLGSGTAQNREPLHSSRFVIDEQVILNGIVTLAAASAHYLRP